MNYLKEKEEKEVREVTSLRVVGYQIISTRRYQVGIKIQQGEWK